MIKNHEIEKKPINLYVWSILNLVLPVPVLIVSGLFATWAFFTFVTEGGIVRPERKFIDDIIMLPLYITSIGILISCVAAIVFSIKKRKECRAVSCILMSAACFLMEIFMWAAMLYIGSNF